LGSDPLEINEGTVIREILLPKLVGLFAKNLERLNFMHKMVDSEQTYFLLPQVYYYYCARQVYMPHYSSRPGSKYFNSINLQNKEHFHGQLPDDRRFYRVQDWGSIGKVH